MNRAALFFSLSIAATAGLVACGGGSSDAAPVPGSGAPAPPPGAPTPAPAPPPPPCPRRTGFDRSPYIDTDDRRQRTAKPVGPGVYSRRHDAVHREVPRSFGAICKWHDGASVRYGRIIAGCAGSVLRGPERRSRHRRRSGLRDRNPLRVRLHGVQPDDEPAHQSRRSTDSSAQTR